MATAGLQTPLPRSHPRQGDRRREVGQGRAREWLRSWSSTRRLWSTYLVDNPLAARVADRIRDSEVLVPAHFDAEVLSALGRLQRRGELSEAQVETRVTLTAQAPFHRQTLAPLLEGAWARHHSVRLVDALSIELANQLDATIITTDSGMSAATANAEHIK